MRPYEQENGVEVVPLTVTTNQCGGVREKLTRTNKRSGLRHNKKHVTHNDKHPSDALSSSCASAISSSSSTSSSNKDIETNSEATIRTALTQDEILGSAQITSSSNAHINNNASGSNNNKKRRRSSVLTPLRKKITRKMSLAFSRSNSGLARIDLSGFQHQEQEKTIVRKNLRWHATFLFFLAVVATAIVLLDTQMKVQWIKQSTFLSSLDPVGPLNTTDDLLNNQLQTELDKLELYRNVGIGLKAMLSVVSILTCVSLLYYYRNLFRMKKVRHFFPQKMSFLRATPLVKKYLIECAICLFHVPPYLDLYVEVPNEVQVFALLRLYLLGRYLKEKHELMNSQSTRFLASVTKTELTGMFLFKTFFMQYPFQLILLAYFILLFIGGYGVWMIEDQYTYLVSEFIFTLNNFYSE